MQGGEPVLPGPGDRADPAGFAPPALALLSAGERADSEAPDERPLGASADTSGDATATSCPRGDGAAPLAATAATRTVGSAGGCAAVPVELPPLPPRTLPEPATGGDADAATSADCDAADARGDAVGGAGDGGDAGITGDGPRGVTVEGVVRAPVVVGVAAAAAAAPAAA